MPWFAKLFPAEWIEDGMADPARMRTDGPLQVRARARFRRLFATRTSLEWERLINEELGVPTAICQTTEDWLLRDDHARNAGAVIDFVDPEFGSVVGAGYPVHLSTTPMMTRGGRHPLDADRVAVLAPVVSAQYGAEVVKINSFEDVQLGAHFFTNNGKRSMLLDLKKPEGLGVLWRLVEDADIFSQNFARGVPERLGISEADVRRHRPDIIYSSVSAFGPAGRRAPYRGREELGQAVTGMQVRWGGFGAEPATGHLAFTDYGTGHFAAFAVLVALYHRMRTGVGQAVHASLAQTGTFLQVPFMLAYEGRVWDEPNGRSLPKGSGPLDRFYQGGDGEWFYLAAMSPDGRSRLSKVAGITELAGRDDDDLELTLAADFVEQDARVWVERLQRAGIGAHAFVCAEELAESPEAIARGLTIFADFPFVGRVRTSAPAKRLSLTPPVAGRLVGPPGSDTREVLEALGLGAKVAELFEGDVVRDSPSEDILGVP